MPRIATIGFFDGVHRGHRFLFAQLHEYAMHHQLTPTIYTFDRHPKELLTGQAPAMLTTHDERKALLQHYGEVHFLDFAAVQQLTAEQFMQCLYEQYDVEVLLLGYDHHFGSDCLKGFSEYEKIAHRVGLRVLRAHECLVDGVPVSSSRIRQLLAAGQVHDANRLLGYDYTLTGTVIHGNGIGTQIGFPTANIQLLDSKKLPMQGVYAAHAQMDGVEYHAIVNVGTNPTIGNDHITIEAHIIDYKGDLYGRLLAISFVRFLRAEQKFASLSALQQQIQRDLQSL